MRDDEDMVVVVLLKKRRRRRRIVAMTLAVVEKMRMKMLQSAPYHVHLCVGESSDSGRWEGGGIGERALSVSCN